MKHQINCLKILLALFSFLISSSSVAQTTNGAANNENFSNSLVTAVPFLLVIPDARTAAMGDAGIAMATDANASTTNAAKLGFAVDPSGISISYTPWLNSYTPDINLAYLSGFYRLNNRNTLGASIRFFSLGDIQLSDNNFQDLGIYSPSEAAYDFSYARKFGNSFALGATLRYITSALSRGDFAANRGSGIGNAIAADISGYYTNELLLFNTNTRLSLGFNISNIGTKMRYSSAGPYYFLPANLGLGGALTFSNDNRNEFTAVLDFNKLLVPTPSGFGANVTPGITPEKSVPEAIFGSFTDAPNGFAEELKEISIGGGMEYLYDKKFALRAGYFYESPQKGNRQYATFGTGFSYKTIILNFSYLLANSNKSPMANTLRFSLSFNFGKSM
jgi:hypothetical protein